MKKMQFIQYPQGRIAWVEGLLVRLFGLMIGFEWTEGQDGNPDIKTIRIPLEGEGCAPMPAIMGEDTLESLVVFKSGGSVTLDELMHILYLKRKFFDNDDLCILYRELYHMNVSVIPGMSVNIPLSVEDDGRMFCKSFLIHDRHLIRDLALLQHILDLPIAFNTDFCTDKGVACATRVDAFLRRIRTNGLYYGEDDGVTVYYDGTYKFTGNGENAVAMSLDEFKRECIGVGVKISPTNNI